MHTITQGSYREDPPLIQPQVLLPRGSQPKTVQKLLKLNNALSCGLIANKVFEFNNVCLW